MVSLIHQLSEEIAVAQALFAQVAVKMHHSWQLAVIIIIINLAAQAIEGIGTPHEVQLSMPTVHPAVRATVADGHAIRFQFKGIVIFRIDILPHSGESQPLADILLIAQERTHIAKGTHFQLCRQMRMLVCGGHTDGLNTQNGWYRGIAGRDEDIVVVADDQRQLIDIVERIA